VTSSSRPHPCPLDEQAVAWVLDALEPDEELEFEQHLPQCPSCQAAVRDAEDVLAELGGAVEQVDPPPSLRENLLAQAAQTPQTPHTPQARPAEPSPSPDAAPPARDPAPSTASGSRRLPAAGTREPPRRRRERGSGWFSARSRQVLAASLALVGVLTIGGLAVHNAQLTQQRDAEIAQVRTIADLLVRFDDPDTRHAILATPDGPAVAAVLVADGERTVVTPGLAANPPDESIYVLWGLSDAGPVPLDTFDVADADPGPHAVGSAPDADGFTGYAISLEPGRTAPVEPSDVVASGQVTT
jgi:anti-sigma-K factor RskA